MGTLRGFDQFMNLVIGNTVEVKGEEKNEIGMVVFNRIQPSLSCFIAVWIGYDGMYYYKYRKGPWPLIFHFALVLLDRKVERDYPRYSERKRKVERYYCRTGGGKREIRRRKRLRMKGWQTLKRC
ncbi:putative sm-like protein Lsm7/SmG [Helianthus annuus]|nr:putative LSM domain, eukaryotic/archaea-type, LSM domain superfamily protein [Helianthus annuus]KAJ0777913.1 putative sm-like protein Lsm7/SmG [Helianthus annuus]KAJ0786926.1 putative sm-like protein Lsm7/SmG [Helianthus annuus]